MPNAIMQASRQHLKKTQNLDHYEDEGVDDEEYEMNPEARKAA